MVTTILPQIGIACATAAATALYLLKAKRSTPITRKDANILWTLHTLTAQCNCHKMQPLKLKNGEIAGFQCQCGYRYTQKRPLLSRKPTNPAAGIMQNRRVLGGSAVQLDARQI